MEPTLRDRAVEIATATVYWGLITPAAFVLRLLRRSPHRGIDRRATTYWVSRNV